MEGFLPGDAAGHHQNRRAGNCYNGDIPDTCDETDDAAQQNRGGQNHLPLYVLFLCCFFGSAFFQTGNNIRELQDPLFECVSDRAEIDDQNEAKRSADFGEFKEAHFPQAFVHQNPLGNQLGRGTGQRAEATGRSTHADGHQNVLVLYSAV